MIEKIKKFFINLLKENTHCNQNCYQGRRCDCGKIK